MTAHPSLSASIEQLENSFEAARGDYAQLKLIADALQHHSAPGAPRLRIKVVAEMFRLKRETGVASAPRSPPPTPLLALLGRFGVDAPDGRPLHRYRLGAEGYDQLTALLRHRAARLTSANGSDAALLVLWASVWFRREYSGGIRKYRELSAARQYLSAMAWRPGHLVMIEYFDRYLKCPLSVRLACECIAALSKAIGSGEQTQMSLVSEPWRSNPRFDDKRPWQVSHDWRSDDDRTEATEAMATKLGMKGALTLKRDRHAREMILTFDDSSSVTLVFDQGFGSWSGPKGTLRAVLTVMS